MLKKTPVVLMILDGWGYSENKEHNAIYSAKTPQWDAWWKTCPHVLLDASGPSVGLPDKQMGNSEVGHMHIGAGRVVPQDLTRIDAAIAHGEYDKNTIFLDAIQSAKQHGKAMHIMGLLSPGGVHSHENHLFAFLTLCAQLKFSSVYLHLFLDGRDTPPQSALTSLAKLQEQLRQNPIATISSISGRYYAMDRDTRWQRIEPVYQMLTNPPKATLFKTATDAIQSFYQKGIFDEFIPPTPIGQSQAIQEGDSLFFFNFRADRARQLTQAFLAPNFQGFNREQQPKLNQFISMTSYSDDLPTCSAFPALPLSNTLGEVLSKHGLRQLRLAETEKYAHITFFLNGGSEQVFPNETRLLINSPNVATYDLQPEMSAEALTNALINAIQQGDYDVIICNYANADMVGHTGNLPATVLAIECLDRSMQRVGEALNHVGGQLLITADHGNAESMFDDVTHQPHTAHTNQPVPFLYVGHNNCQAGAPAGHLTDVAPTVLTLLGITPPIEMTGHTLLVRRCP